MIPAVVLAAGLSTRMGRTKATLSVDARGECAATTDTFLTRIIGTLTNANPTEIAEIVVVVGHDAEAVVESVTARGLAPRFVFNARYAEGQFSSVLAGLAAIDRPGVRGMLLTLVDVPLVSAETVRAVLSRHREAKPSVVRPVRGTKHGHPVVIDRSLFPLVRAANPAQGLKPVVRAHASTAGDVHVDDDGAFLDVDTPAAYAALLEQLQRT